tara:strand:+ start:707 stop:1465 length:759 start_codon:yes stop_codon:yes gene_type:complete
MNDNFKKFYDVNGYVILEKIFSDIEAEKFNSSVRRHANKSFSALINPDRYDSLLDQDERPKSDITLKEIEETSSMARSIMTDKRMIELLEFFHENKAVGLSSQFIFKEAYSDYCMQAWRPHQDNFYPKSKNAAYITLNWFLKDADKDNGTIYCYPGSHKLGLLPAENNISFREKVGDNPGSECKIPEEFLDRKTDIIIPANSIVILNGNCIHGSYPNISNRSRPWFSSCYISEDEDFVVGNSSKRKKIKLSK